MTMIYSNHIIIKRNFYSIVHGELHVVILF